MTAGVASTDSRLQRDSRLDRLERRIESVVRFVPYVSLAFSTVLTVVSAPFIPQPPLPVTLAVSAAAALWVLWWVTLHPGWQDRRGLMAVYFAGLAGFILALIAANPLYGFFAFSGYLHTVYALRGRWRGVGIVTTAFLAALSQVGGVSTFRSGLGLALYLVVALFNAGLAIAMASLAWVGDAQTDRHKRMIAELADANARLEAALAENAGLHAQLLTQAREAGVMDERQRMAGEIHDTLAQGLTGIITQLEAADATGAQPTDRRRHVLTAAQLARESLAEARRSVHALRPRPLDGAHLTEALAEAVARWSERTGTAAELATTGTARPLLPDIEVALLRTAQEALANVAKHAGASWVRLTLSYMEDLVTLDVRDDGGGFDPAAVPAHTPDGGGFGLPAMRERLHRVAGTLAVESEPGAGTAVSACVPAIAAGG